MMRDYSYAYEWDQEYCYESIITTPISEEEQKENIRLFFGNRGKPLVWLREANP